MSNSDDEMKRREMENIKNLTTWTLKLILNSLESFSKERSMTGEEIKLKSDVEKILKRRCYEHDKTDCLICQCPHSTGLETIP